MRRVDLGAQRNGRRAAPIVLEPVGQVSKADLALLAGNRGIQPLPLKAIRDRHHSVARYLAQGFPPSEVSALTGLCPSRINILQNDPAFKALVVHYAEVAESAQADFIERATTASLTAINELQERLEESPEKFTTGELLEIVEVTADRSGHAPVSKSVSVSATVDFGARLEEARRRSKAAKEPILIEGAKIAEGGPSG